MIELLNEYAMTFSVELKEISLLPNNGFMNEKETYLVSYKKSFFEKDFNNHFL